MNTDTMVTRVAWIDETVQMSTIEWSVIQDPKSWDVEYKMFMRNIDADWKRILNSTSFMTPPPF